MSSHLVSEVWNLTHLPIRREWLKPQICQRWPNSWMVYNGKSPSQKDDNGYGTPMNWNPPLYKIYQNINQPIHPTIWFRLPWPSSNLWMAAWLWMSAWQVQRENNGQETNDVKRTCFDLHYRPCQIFQIFQIHPIPTDLHQLDQSQVKAQTSKPQNFRFQSSKSSKSKGHWKGNMKKPNLW